MRVLCILPVIATIEVYQLLMTKIAKMTLWSILSSLIINISFFKSNHNRYYTYYLPSASSIVNKNNTTSCIWCFSFQNYPWVKWLGSTPISTLFQPIIHGLHTYFLLCEFVVFYNDKSTNILDSSSCLINP